MELLALAIAPGFAICLFIFYRDAYDREPKLNLVVSFFLGALTVYPAAFIEQFLYNTYGNGLAGTAIKAFLVVALTEELGKFLVLRLYAFRRKSFDEPLDGIVYAVMISMGFATLENILYVVQSAQVGLGYQTAFLRMFLAVPAHATFGVLMGYYTGLAKFDAVNRSKLLFLALLWPVLFHGLYDLFLFLRDSPEVTYYVADGLLVLGAIASFIVGIRLSLNHIKKHRRFSQKKYNPTELMEIRKAYPHDIPLIRDLANQSWPITYSSILSKEQVDYMMELIYSEKSLAAQMEKGHEFVIAYDGVEPVGFASVSLLEPGIYKLQKLYVLPSEHGKGMGKFILNELIKAMKTKGGRLLKLNVNRFNKARDFYEKLGFTVIGEEDIDIGNGYFMNDYVMKKEI